MAQESEEGQEDDGGDWAGKTAAELTTVTTDKKRVGETAWCVIS